MTYEEIEVETLTGTQKHVVVFYEGGGAKSFPVDPENPEYAAWAVAEGLMEAPAVVEPTPVEIIETAPVEL